MDDAGCVDVSQLWVPMSWEPYLLRPESGKDGRFWDRDYWFWVHGFYRKTMDGIERTCEFLRVMSKNFCGYAFVFSGESPLVSFRETGHLTRRSFSWGSDWPKEGRIKLELSQAKVRVVTPSWWTFCLDTLEKFEGKKASVTKVWAKH